MVDWAGARLLGATKFAPRLALALDSIYSVEIPGNAEKR
jgi:hypothetical protein